MTAWFTLPRTFADLDQTVLSLAFLGLAAGIPFIKRQDDSTSCGSNDYSSSQVDSAVNAACNYISEGEEAGSSKYPEKYNDYEGFSFGGASKPYYEFPILESGTYKGGEPGADRVVVSTADGDCVLAGVITHTGASGNDFVGCSGTS